ncbi:MAG: HD-GYP domain-containing protein, partial [Pseudomonadales bacterium]|nr:HD-GYP domain-containing protein [Pseudomonadales bacterium]
EFQAELVEAFIQAIGVYPAGTIVELSSGEVGVVVSEYRTRRLKPRVAVLLDAAKNRLREPQVLDLHELAESETRELAIARALEPNAYGIDLAELDILAVTN